MEKNKLDSIGRMTPEMREVVEFESKQMKELLKIESIDPQDQEAYILTRKYWNEGGPKLKKIVDENIRGPHRDILFRLYYPNETEKNRCILFIHGGGFVVGNIDTHDGIMRRLSIETGAVVVGIDYKLAPQFKFPVPIEECIFLIHHLRENADKYKIDKDDITLAGDSAGAYLSLATAINMRDKEKDISFIKSLLLYYGSFGLADSMSKRLYGGYWDGLTIEALDGYSDVFTKEEDKNNPYRILFDSDLTFGIPPTYIMACELDPLLDDSKLLYEILKEHGMKTELNIVDGVIHGFLHYSKKLPQSMETIKDSARFYKTNK